VDLRAPDDEPDPSAPVPPTPAGALIVAALLAEVVHIMREGSYGTQTDVA
jgi:hypothetical protein